MHDKHLLRNWYLKHIRSSILQLLSRLTLFSVRVTVLSV
jgi:hypothetical protein